MTNSKIIVGWVLVTTGVALIIWTLISSYNIFTDKADLPEIFIEQNQSLAQTANGGDIQEQMQNLVQEQLKNLIPTQAIMRILNLSAWSILAFIFIFGGTKIADLGIKLLKKEG
jgi:hypothetical protein